MQSPIKCIPLIGIQHTHEGCNECAQFYCKKVSPYWEHENNVPPHLSPITPAYLHFNWRIKWRILWLLHWLARERTPIYRTVSGFRLTISLTPKTSNTVLCRLITSPNGLFTVHIIIRETENMHIYFSIAFEINLFVACENTYLTFYVFVSTESCI